MDETGTQKMFFCTQNKLRQELSSSWDGRPWPQ